jgi:hypothetical protein
MLVGHADPRAQLQALNGLASLPRLRPRESIMVSTTVGDEHRDERSAWCKAILAAMSPGPACRCYPCSSACVRVATGWPA